MVVGCVNCQTKFVVPDDKVPETGVKVRCSKCQHTFHIKKERVKKGGPSSVIMIDPGLMAEIEREKEAPRERQEGPAAGVQLADDLGAGASSPPIPDDVSTANMAKALEAGAQRRVSTQIINGPESLAAPATSTQKLHTNIIQRPLRAAAPMSAPQEEEVLELSEVYLPPDWTKRITASLFLLLGLALAVGIAGIIRNDFQVPSGREFFNVLLNGPKKRSGLDLTSNALNKSFDSEKKSVEKVLTAGGVSVVSVQGEIKNTDRVPHGQYFVKVILKSATEKLESERPCVKIESPSLVALTSEAELDALYKDGMNGANKSVDAYGETTCTVAFFAAPEWAGSPAQADFVVTRVDGAQVAP